MNAARSDKTAVSTEDESLVDLLQRSIDRVKQGKAEAIQWDDGSPPCPHGKRRITFNEQGKVECIECWNAGSEASDRIRKHDPNDRHEFRWEIKNRER